MGWFRRLLQDQASVAAVVGRSVVSGAELPPPGSSTNSPSYLSAVPPYQYTPLPSPTTQFRILCLEPTVADLNTPWPSMLLRGSLVTHPIEAPPEYYALSYCWGDATPCEPIVVDGAVLRITKSCATALRRLLKGKVKRMIWVDSICINQAGDQAALKERGAQVAMMDRIYRGAVQVNVDLGEGDAAADVACRALKKLMAYYLGAIVPGFQSGYFRKKYEALADDVLACTPEYPYGKLYGLFRQPWFERYWVIQEVALAERVLLYCGDNLLHLKAMIFGSDFSRLPYSKLESNITSRHWRFYTMYHEAVQTWIRQREDPSANPNTALPKLADVLIPPALMFEATRPEDKVHALYGICKRIGYDLPAPDYTKPLATVYTDAAQAILRYDGQEGLDALLQSACESQSGWEAGIPSWVPNLAGCQRRWTPSNLPHMFLNDRKNTLPCGSASLGCEFELGADPIKLRIKGRRLDVACETGKPWMMDNSTNPFRRAPLPSENHITTLLPSLESWLGISARSLGAASPDQTPGAALRLAQVLAQDGECIPSAEMLEELAHYLQVAMASWKLRVGSGRLVLAEPQADPREHVRYGDCLLSAGMYAAFGKIYPMGWKTVFRTTRGFIGAGPHSVRDGDIIALFQGCSMAAVVRPWREDFRYVGPAYVLGAMHGEFWDTGSSANNEWFSLL